MITLLIGWAAKLVGPRFAKPLLIGAGILAILVLLGTAKCAYDRSVIKRHNLEQEAKQAKRERKADTNLERARDAHEEAAAIRKQEIDNATRNLPDQAPSARQRARVCVELRRQAQERRQPVPAC
jgi:predicted  nucleic acid-binding Zn-ribbon protein